MNRKRKQIQSFDRWCRNTFRLEHIPTHVLYKEKALATETGIGFGVTVVMGSEIHSVWVAGKWPKKIVMKILAHEYAHCIQHINGQDYDEQKADKMAEYMLINYMESLKVKKRRKWKR